MERALMFATEGERLLGILHEGASGAVQGVLVVVGGPQYRVGSHRQFLLLARHLARQGIPVFRFDYRGMGDSSGAQTDFEDAGQDICQAIDAFLEQAPTVREVVIWGLCDGASAATIYAARDRRVTGLVLLNPWLRTKQGLARAFLRHYYLRRLLSAEFWQGLLRGSIKPAASARSLWQILQRQLPGKLDKRSESNSGISSSGAVRPLPVRVAEAWRTFQGPILLILSGEDLIAAEFTDTVARVPEWEGLLTMERVTRRDLPEANHTFSRKIWRDQVAAWTIEWLEHRGSPPHPGPDRLADR